MGGEKREDRGKKEITCEDKRMEEKQKRLEGELEEEGREKDERLKEIREDGGGKTQDKRKEGTEEREKVRGRGEEEERAGGEGMKRGKPPSQHVQVSRYKRMTVPKRDSVVASGEELRTRNTITRTLLCIHLPLPPHPPRQRTLPLPP